MNTSVAFLLADVMEKISAQITSRSYGRLFAVVYINEKQFKVSERRPQQ